MKSYLRVSEILARLQDFGNIDPEVLENKQKIGTNVHEAILSDSIGDYPLLETERVAAYFGSYERWKNKEKPNYKMQIPRLYCDDLRITGEIDALADFGMKHPTLCDWKCSATPNPEIWNLQAHFYWYLLKQNGIEVSDHMKWVNLRHKKWIEEGSCGELIERYASLPPVVVDFFFNEESLSRCIQEAQKAWEEKKDSLVLDFN